MAESKRHRDILNLLQQNGTLSIAELAGRLGVSFETVRRDLRPLADNHAIVRMHGAVALPSMLGEAPFERRLRDNPEAKKAIARELAATIRDGDSIMLDTGTTTSILARELLGHRRLTVITNSSDIARTLATSNENRVYMAGGELRSDNGAAFGSTAIEFISRFNVLHAVISVGAVSAGSGASSVPAPTSLTGTTAVASSSGLSATGTVRIAVTDHSKFNRSGLVKVCDFSDLTHLVTDGTPPPDIMSALESAGVTCLIASLT